MYYTTFLHSLVDFKSYFLCISRAPASISRPFAEEPCFHGKILYYQYETEEEFTAATTEIPETDVIAEIKKYKELFDLGAITEEKFAAKKKQLMGI